MAVPTKTTKGLAPVPLERASRISRVCIDGDLCAGAVPKQASAAGEVISRGCPQQAHGHPKQPTACANQPFHASVAGRVDHGSVCCRNQGPKQASRACTGKKTPQPNKLLTSQRYVSQFTPTQPRTTCAESTIRRIVVYFIEVLKRIYVCFSINTFVMVNKKQIREVFSMTSGCIPIQDMRSIHKPCAHPPGRTTNIEHPPTKIPPKITFSERETGVHPEGQRNTPQKITMQRLQPVWRVATPVWVLLCVYDLANCRSYPALCHGCCRMTRWDIQGTHQLPT